MQAITLGPRLKVEFMKKKTRLAHRQEGKAFPVKKKKNKTCFERNEETVWSVIVVSVESMRSRIKISKDSG